MCVGVYFSFTLTSKFVINGRLEKCYPTDKCNKSTPRICLIYFSMAPFIDTIKFHLWNLKIKDLMLIHFHISSITKRFFQSLDRHSDKTVTLSELLPNVNKFRIKILDFFRKFHERGFWIVRVVLIHVFDIIIFLKKWPPVNS